MTKREKDLENLIRSKEWFMQALRAVRTCNPPDWLVGGGVIRTLVWDYLHGYDALTRLNDVDVAFFDPVDLRRDRDEAVEHGLKQLLPAIPWQARNQARVHLWYESKFGFPVESLISSADGVSTWPETATSVAVRLLAGDELTIIAPCGLDDLFECVCRRNPRRVSTEIFEKRLADKKILEKWPNVQVIHESP